jgi:hypothetical protein
MQAAVRAKLHWLVPLVAAWLWFCSVANRSAEQVLNLDNVENYGLAVFCQLFWGWAEIGEWVQTIHFGYVDSWMWSGHRVGWLPFVGWLYGLNPDPVWLTRIQIAIVSLGALPAWGMGRDEIHSRWGGFAGLVIYLGFPPVAALALQDYQDLVLCIPFLVGAVWQCRKGSTTGFLLFSLAACMCREELVPMVVLIGLTHPGSWRQRLPWLIRAAALAGLYAALIAWLGRDFTGYDNPMLSHSGDMVLQWPPVWTRTMDDVGNFYLAFVRPVHFLAILSPLTVLPGIGALFFHLTAPAHGGVDTTWTGHIHHMAPVVGFVIAATIESTGRLVRWSSRTGRARTLLLAGGGAFAFAATAILAAPWINYLGLHFAFNIERPDTTAPEWSLVADLPIDAAVATDAKMSLVIANRRHAYTYDESLPDKRPGEGLSAVDFILVRKLDRSWVNLIQQEGGKPIGETERYELYDLR